MTTPSDLERLARVEVQVKSQKEEFGRRIGNIERALYALIGGLLLLGGGLIAKFLEKGVT